MKRRFIPVLPFTVGLILISGLAYVLEKKKQAKPPLPRKNHHEKREHRRLNLYAHALVKKEGTDSVCSGEISNISDKGVYVTTNGLFSKDDLLDLTIYFQHGTKKLSMTVPCRVARNDGKGVGLTSSHMDAKMLQHLELIFDESKDNSKQLIEEFTKAVCFI
jgi:hypothetical protein